MTRLQNLKQHRQGYKDSGSSAKVARLQELGQQWQGYKDSGTSGKATKTQAPVARMQDYKDSGRSGKATRTQATVAIKATTAAVGPKVASERAFLKASLLHSLDLN